jgi:hypothetical protein
VYRQYKSSGEFEAVSCWSETMCLAVGDASFTEVWNGAEWKLLTSPPRPRYSSFQGVSCWSRSGCIAVGSAWDPTHLGYLSVADVWNGRQWKRLATPPVPPRTPRESRHGGNLPAVSCWSSRGCMALGIGFSDIWNGHSWSVQTMSPPLTHGGLTGLSCWSAGRCIAVGGTNYPFKTLAGVWDGHSWKVEATPTPSDYGFLNGVSCWSSIGCTAVGTHDLGVDTNKPLVEALG